MTQNTQTTAQRILTILRDHLEFYAGSGEWAAATEAGEQIAAEIDALKAQLAAQDAALVDMPKLAALLATAERERDEARAELHHTTNEFAVILRERNDAHLALATRTQERDAALALIESHHKARNEARAEVERLRPLAEAWLYKQACEAWDAGRITPFEFAEAHKLYSPQARRAREARGGA